MGYETQVSIQKYKKSKESEKELNVKSRFGSLGESEQRSRDQARMKKVLLRRCDCEGTVTKLKKHKANELAR